MIDVVQRNLNASFSLLRKVAGARSFGEVIELQASHLSYQVTALIGQSNELAYPDLYAAIGVHSGLPYKSAADLPSAFAAMRGDGGPLGLRSRKLPGAATDGSRIRTIVFHGDADNIVHHSNGSSIVGTAEKGENVERAETRSECRGPYTYPHGD